MNRTDLIILVVGAIAIGAVTPVTVLLYYGASKEIERAALRVEDIDRELDAVAAAEVKILEVDLQRLRKKYRTDLLDSYNLVRLTLDRRLLTTREYMETVLARCENILARL